MLIAPQTADLPAFPAAPPVAPPRVEETASPVAASLCRRLRLALYDLGLAGVVEGLAQRDSVAFAPVSIRQADALVRRLEDLGACVPAASTRAFVHPGQLRLDGMDAAQ